jgi:TonB family protein
VIVIRSNCDEAEGSKMTKDFLLAPSLIASTLIHLATLILASALFGHRSYLSEQQLVSISLLDLPQEEKTTHPLKEYKPNIEKKIDRSPLMKKSVKETPARIKHEAVIAQPSSFPPLTPKSETAQPDETKVSPPGGTARFEGGGSETHAENLFGRGDNGVTPGSGSAGGGGTAAAGSGRGFGTPGSAQSTLLRSNREAKPIQTARASYPPMALRMGVEGDVTLKIEVDPEGRVTKAEIIKSAGAGFDEEALKAVRQSRFEPAQRDGHNVLAEFTYIYRFRLQR